MTGHYLRYAADYSSPPPPTAPACECVTVLCILNFFFFQKKLPGRFKGFHFYNAGTLLDAFMMIFKPFLDKKFQERVRRYEMITKMVECISL